MSDTVNSYNEQTTQPIRILQWTHQIDNMLASWCDHAKCFEWMHNKSYSYYYNISRIYIIIINILTAISGIVNIILSNISDISSQTGWIFGSLSILISAVNMIYDKLGYSVTAEIHHKLASQWHIIKSKIEEMVILPLPARTDCKSFIKYIKSDMNNATQLGASLIPSDILNQCYNQFNNISGFDVPDICGQVEHTITYSETDALLTN